MNIRNTTKEEDDIIATVGKAHQKKNGGQPLTPPALLNLWLTDMFARMKQDADAYESGPVLLEDFNGATPDVKAQIRVLLRGTSVGASKHVT
jgi:hypothetical protein